MYCGGHGVLSERLTPAPSPWKRVVHMLTGGLIPRPVQHPFKDVFRCPQVAGSKPSALSLCVLSRWRWLCSSWAPTGACTQQAKVAGASSAPVPASGLNLTRCLRDLEQGTPLAGRGVVRPGMFCSSGSEGWGAAVGASPWCSGPCPHLPHVSLQDGSMVRGCGMERWAGSPRTLPGASPTKWPWRAMCAGWSVCGWRRMCSLLCRAPRKATSVHTPARGRAGLWGAQ